MDTVLVVEHSRPIQRTLQRLFESDSLEVRIASDGISAVEIFQNQTPSVVTLDLCLPGLSGKEVCQAFKSYAPAVPVVVVSVTSKVEDKVLLFELGADDFVTIPFNSKELLARVRRALRRTELTRLVTSSIRLNKINHEVFAFGEVWIDFTSMTATHSGKPIHMTRKELELLRFFVRSPDRVFTRGELLRELWGHKNSSTRTVDNYILRLRRNLEPDPAKPRYFVTKYRAGYRFVPSGK